MIAILSDFDLIIHKFDEPHDLKIYPISDVHLGAREHCQKEWAEFLTFIKNDPLAKVCLCGDLLNNATKSSVSDIYDEMLSPGEQKRRMTEMLMPIRDRILCAVNGNHERRSKKESDVDLTYDIMCKLDLEDLYRPNVAFVKIMLGETYGDGRLNPTYVMAVTRGAGGGGLTGANVNKNERFGYVIDGLDVLVPGHSHKPWVSQQNKITIDAQNNKVSFKPFKVVSSSSWLNYGGYATQKMLLPSSNTRQIITLKRYEKDIRVEM